LIVKFGTGFVRAE